MKISTIYHGSVVGGPTGGTFQIVVELSQEGSTLSVPDCLALILKYTKERPAPVRIDGDLESADQSEMLAFCSTLRDFGYPLSIITDGMVRPNWFYLIPYVIVQVNHDDPWLRFECQEFRYLLAAGVSTEPPFPPKPCPCYLYVTSGVNLEDLFRFLEKSTRPWGVIHNPSKVYKRTIWSKEGEKK